jgi:hypothetical protein
LPGTGAGLLAAAALLGRRWPLGPCRTSSSWNSSSLPAGCTTRSSAVPAAAAGAAGGAEPAAGAASGTSLRRLDVCSCCCASLLAPPPSWLLPAAPHVPAVPCEPADVLWLPPERCRCLVNAALMALATAGLAALVFQLGDLMGLAGWGPEACCRRECCALLPCCLARGSCSGLHPVRSMGAAAGGEAVGGLAGAAAAAAAAAAGCCCTRLGRTGTYTCVAPVSGGVVASCCCWPCCGE